jgi:hypothetical protein
MKIMITNEGNPAGIYEAAQVDEGLLERSMAPTLRDFRVEAEDLLTSIEADADSTPPDDGLPQRED